MEVRDVPLRIPVLEKVGPFPFASRIAFCGFRDPIPPGVAEVVTDHVARFIVNRPLARPEGHAWLLGRKPSPEFHDQLRMHRHQVLPSVLGITRLEDDVGRLTVEEERTRRQAGQLRRAQAGERGYQVQHPPVRARQFTERLPGNCGLEQTREFVVTKGAADVSNVDVDVQSLQKLKGVLPEGAHLHEPRAERLQGGDEVVVRLRPDLLPPAAGQPPAGRGAVEVADEDEPAPVERPPAAGHDLVGLFGRVPTVEVVLPVFGQQFLQGSGPPPGGRVVAPRPLGVDLLEEGGEHHLGRLLVRAEPGPLDGTVGAANVRTPLRGRPEVLCAVLGERVVDSLALLDKADVRPPVVGDDRRARRQKTGTVGSK
nr:hypothetical protein [Limnoglobus roseus]